ncbi:L-2-amino-thiazoline-4-carboxylic acid hydrolase [Solibacillus sp. A46]|uniref:L-2-amino-thiazoline-4-carboxylic acid hydrolase n=1 Tax=Solibacillus faecavium TaxID=2762221 RepID=A0ABR8XXC5_9BACL|nr:L-2-amino-thiazoline-4-carboxylic acid hydrolase [Solibacillus faecavium]MBD8036597.1 L-2-amino-thiazoline-4-carboxylic acid hydrolase [Solibacillus faecavium]
MEQQPVSIKPYSMEYMTAMLFTQIETNAKEAFWQEVVPLIQNAVRSFGYYNAEQIAIKATLEGSIHSLYDYIPTDHQATDNYENATPFALFAKLFAQVTKQIVDRYGNEGEEVIKKSVWQFGQKRGRGIAQRARLNGQENTVENYIPNYDMGRSELFVMEDNYTPNELEQTFTGCPLGQQWADDNMHDYGILYCQVIDNSIAYGYNNKFDVIHDQYLLREGQCHFRFQMKEKGIDPLYD